MSLTQPTKVTWTLARPPRYQNPGQNNTQEGIGALLISLPKEVKRAPITPFYYFFRPARRRSPRCRRRPPPRRPARPPLHVCASLSLPRSLSPSLHVLYIYICTHTYSPFHSIPFHGMAWHGMAWHGIALHCITLHYVMLRCMALHYITLQYTTIHTLHYITLHYIT